MAARLECLPVRDYGCCISAPVAETVRCPGISRGVGLLYPGVATFPGPCDRSESVLSSPIIGLRRPYSGRMKSLLALSLAAAMSTVSAAEIPSGTHVLLRMEHSVNSRTAKVGD